MLLLHSAANSIIATECSCVDILLSCNMNYIWIQSANSGMTSNNYTASNNFFCDDPVSNPSTDCIVSQIDDAIVRCFGYSNCRLELTDFYPLNCNPSGFAYLCIQYSCVPSETLFYFNFVRLIARRLSYVDVPYYLLPETGVAKSPGPGSPMTQKKWPFLEIEQ